ncbi:MAG TPA: RAMP superfamily CRISPR-associated protein, partial [Candidatus Cloacimonadota bacterium]|nr:RAMP superfamily CRISPR-associated protein [Candidatus Cloacimonadota bacterium]
MTSALNIRYLANFLVEAETPLKIGSGDAGLLTDALIMTDSNGLPLILGTSLCGVLRHSLLNSGVCTDEVNSIFGYQNDKSDDGAGSRLIVSNGFFTIEGNKAIEGFNRIKWHEEFFSRFKALPLRQHAKINHQGVADKENHGKFDEQVIYKGTRFRFELELAGTMQDKDNWGKMIEQISRPDFRIGGGTRKGFGKLKVVEVRSKVLDLNHDFELYLNKTASVNDMTIYDKPYQPESKDTGQWKKYTLTLKPENTWLFGSGLGD